MKRIKLQLSTQIFIGMAIGVLLGFIFTYGVEIILSKTSVSKEVAESYKTTLSNGLVTVADFFAQLFLRMLKMIIAPLIITSIVSGVTGVGQGKNLGRLVLARPGAGAQGAGLLCHLGGGYRPLGFEGQVFQCAAIPIVGTLH